MSQAVISRSPTNFSAYGTMLLAQDVGQSLLVSAKLDQLSAKHGASGEMRVIARRYLTGTSRPAYGTAWRRRSRRTGRTKNSSPTDRPSGRGSRPRWSRSAGGREPAGRGASPSSCGRTPSSRRSSTGSTPSASAGPRPPPRGGRHRHRQDADRRLRLPAAPRPNAAAAATPAALRGPPREISSRAWPAFRPCSATRTSATCSSAGRDPSELDHLFASVQ